VSENKTSHGETNGIHMHIARVGRAQVVLGHGFPESWYSWRHQLHALAEAGFHAIAPDMRGYVRRIAQNKSIGTRCPSVGDVVGLLDALGTETAVIVGHDWAPPSRVRRAFAARSLRGVIGLSVPFLPRPPPSPTT